MSTPAPPRQTWKRLRDVALAVTALGVGLVIHALVRGARVFDINTSMALVTAAVVWLLCLWTRRSSTDRN